MVPSNEEKAVIELKHDIGRIQKKQHQELTELVNEVTEYVKKEFDNYFIQKYKSNNKDAGYEKVLEQLNFWQKKRQNAIHEKEYAENDLTKQELDVELKFIDKKIASFQKKTEKIKKRCQRKLDEIIKFRNEEVKKLHESIQDFLASCENEEEEDEEEEEEEEEDEDENDYKKHAK